MRVDLDLLAFGDGVDQLELELFSHVGEQLLRLGPVHHLAGERRVARDDLAHLGFDDRQVFRRERLGPGEVVIEAVLDHRPDGDLRAGIELLHGLGHDMGGVVTDERESFRIVAGENADLGVCLDRLGEVLDLAVERHRHRLLAERLGDGFGNVAARDAGFEVAGGAVWKR